jgi:hypothetical protein
MVIHDHVLHLCWFTPDADIEKLMAEAAERRRKDAELREFLDALKRFQGDSAGLMAWMEARARGDLNRDRKLDALRRLAEDPRTPAGEAQAARAALRRLTLKKVYS